MPAPIVNRNLRPTVGHFVHTIATRDYCNGCNGSRFPTDFLTAASSIHKAGHLDMFMLSKRYLYKLHCRRRILITLICWDSTGYELFYNLLRGFTWKGVRLKTRTSMAWEAGYIVEVAWQFDLDADLPNNAGDRIQRITFPCFESIALSEMW